MRTRLAAAVLCILLPLSSATALGPDWDEPDMPAPSRKRPSVFHRPKKSSAAEQLEYARSLRDRGKAKNALSQYLALVGTWHSAKEAPVAQIEHARLLEDMGRHLKAFEEYQYLVDYFTSGFRYDEVLERQFRIANHIMTTKTKFLFFFSSSPDIEKALPLFQAIVVNGPNWSRAPHAQFNIGRIHEQMGSYSEAIVGYQTVQDRYPKSAFATAAQFRKGHCLYVVAQESPHDEYRSQRARTQLQRFLRDHGQREEAETAKRYLAEITARLVKMYYERALFYDKIAKRPQSALITYTDFVNKFPRAETADAARKRIDELKAALGEE